MADDMTGDTAGQSNERTVVVGFDDSDHAWRALRWAIDEAKQRNAGLLIVHTFDYGIAAADQTGVVSLDAFSDAAGRVLDEAVRYAEDQDLQVEGRLEYGSAAKVLIAASREADLLVVGSRGRGGLAGALLGSVSMACVHHATCPVVVIPPPDRLQRAHTDGHDAAGQAPDP